MLDKRRQSRRMNKSFLRFYYIVRDPLTYITSYVIIEDSCVINLAVARWKRQKGNP